MRKLLARNLSVVGMRSAPQSGTPFIILQLPPLNPQVDRWLRYCRRTGQDRRPKEALTYVQIIKEKFDESDDDPAPGGGRRILRGALYAFAGGCARPAWAMTG